MGLQSRPPESLLNHIPCALSTVADNEITYQVVLFRELSIDECVKREMKKKAFFPISKVSNFVQFGSERTVHSSCKTYVVGTLRGGDPHTRPRSAIHSIQALKKVSPVGRKVRINPKIQVKIDLSKENAFVVLFFRVFRCQNFEFANAFRRQFLVINAL